MASVSGDQTQDRDSAIADIIQGNSFALVGHESGPYALMLAVRDSQLVLDIRTATGVPVMMHLLSLRPLRSVLRDYFLMCDAHADAVRSGRPDHIQTVDMGRRGVHDQGAERLAERLDGKIVADFATLRRLFTLLTALHRRG